MFKRTLFQIVLILYLLVITVFSTAFGTIMCAEPFLKEEFVVLKDERAIEELSLLEASVESYISSGEVRNSEFFEIKAEIENMIAQLGESSFTLKDINSIRLRLTKTASQKKYIKPSEVLVKSIIEEQVATHELVLNPLDIKEDTPYKFEVKIGNSKTKILIVYFSQRVIKDILSKAIPGSMEEAAAHKLQKAITHGFVSAEGTNGIKYFTADKSVLEIGIYSKSVGTWRLGAYIHDNALYVTHAVNSGNHGSKGYQQTFINLVHSVKKHNRHDL